MERRASDVEVRVMTTVESMVRPTGVAPSEASLCAKIATSSGQISTIPCPRV